MLIPLYSSPLLFLSARSFRSNLLVFHGHNPCQNIVICCLIKQKRRKNSFQFLIFDTQLAKLKHSTLDIHVGSFFSLTVKLFFFPKYRISPNVGQLFWPTNLQSISWKILYNPFRYFEWNCYSFCGGDDHEKNFHPFLLIHTRFTFLSANKYSVR